MNTNYIECCDCLEGMKRLPDSSIDLILTDPPYQLSSITRARLDQSGDKEVPFSRQQSRIPKGFMGKEWDILPKLEVWKECLRVMCDKAVGCKICGKCIYKIFYDHIQEHLDKGEREK